MITKRIVTGSNADGRSAVVHDGYSPGHFDLFTSAFDVVWMTDSTPPIISGTDDPAEVDHYEMKPPPGGIKWIMLSIPPEAVSQAVDRTAPEYLERMSHFDDGGVMEPDGNGWHTTQTLDFVTIVSGEIDLELDDGVTSLSVGDCVVQRGTRHRWINRGKIPCVMSGIIISAETK